jgi:hypothetical protein
MAIESQELRNQVQIQLSSMATFGDVEKGEALIAQFLARKVVTYSFDLHPELWGLCEIGAYYDGRIWTTIERCAPIPSHGTAGAS